jgi:hypothetical protein
MFVIHRRKSCSQQIMNASVAESAAKVGNVNNALAELCFTGLS